MKDSDAVSTLFAQPCRPLVNAEKKYVRARIISPMKVYDKD